MTITATHGNVTIVTTLYGEVTPERLEREKKIIVHRANMLDAYKPPKKPLFVLHPPEDRWIDKDDELTLGRKRA